MNRRITIHLLPNAHLDPVWLWDRREGLAAGVATCRSVLDLMDEHEELTFIRGESLVYEYIERHDPETFRRIERRVAEGRWDVVGGTLVQQDNNLTDTPTLCHLFDLGQSYFQERFGRRAEAAWSADCFGHAVGLPNVLAVAEIKSFAFTRPPAFACPTPAEVFTWRSGDDARSAEVLCFRPDVPWYGTERHDVATRLDQTLANAQREARPVTACFFGLGNHGGGPTRRQLRDMGAWRREHPEVDVTYSTLHRFFAALRRWRDEAGAEWPVVTKELNFCLRGVYANAGGLKRAFRAAEAAVIRTQALAALEPPASDTDNTNRRIIHHAVRDTAFNAFHDILPGTSTESALDQQTRALHAVLASTRAVRDGCLATLASRIDTTVRPPCGDDHPTGVPVLLFNPLPRPRSGLVEIEASLDARAILPYRGRPDELPIEVVDEDRNPLPFQVVDLPSRVEVQTPWRKRVAVPVSLPAWGWRVFEMAWRKPEAEPAQPSDPATLDRPNAETVVLRNSRWRVTFEVGHGLRVTRDGKSLGVDDRLSFEVIRDRWGTWGGMGEESESLHVAETLDTLRLVEVEAIESGPWRAAARARLRGKDSTCRVDLTARLSAGADQVDFDMRVLLPRSACRLKLTSRHGADAVWEGAVPGGTCTRSSVGEMPVLDWWTVKDSGRGFGFASDGVYNASLDDGVLGATLVRTAPYATFLPDNCEAEPGRPAMDTGPHRHRVTLTPPRPSAARAAADELLQPVEVFPVWPSQGEGARRGSFGGVQPETVRLLSVTQQGGRGVEVRLQNLGDAATVAAVTWSARVAKTKELVPGEITSVMFPQRSC